MIRYSSGLRGQTENLGVAGSSPADSTIWVSRLAAMASHCKFVGENEKKLLELLDLSPIAPDEVYLKPALLKTKPN